MPIHLTTPLSTTNLQGTTTTTTDVKISGFSASGDGDVVATVTDTATNISVGQISFRALTNVNAIISQIETYAVNANLIKGTKV